MAEPPVSVLARDGGVDGFLAVFDWYLDGVRVAEPAPVTPDFLD